MIELADPWNARDVIGSMPHESPTHGSADSHCCNMMTRECLDATSCPCDQPQLWKDRNCTHKETCHPQHVKERSAIHVPMQQGSKNESANCQRQDGEAVCLGLIRAPLHHPNLVQKPHENTEGTNVDDLKDIIS